MLKNGTGVPHVGVLKSGTGVPRVNL